MPRDLTVNEPLLQREEVEQYEVQCTDCYRIFTSETPPGNVTCEQCGSNDIVPW